MHPAPCLPAAMAAGALCIGLAMSSPLAQAQSGTGAGQAHTPETGATHRADRSLRRLAEGWSAPGGHWRVAVSPYTYHWNFSDDHREVYAIALERQRADGWLAGASRFRNSFGQPSAYLYLGWRSGPLWEQEHLFWQWSGGLLYGYRGRFKDKVPLNVNGFSPGALLSLGWHTSERSAVMVHALAAAGVMLQLSWDLR